MVGDRLLTDVLMANLSSMFAIHTQVDEILFLFSFSRRNQLLQIVYFFFFFKLWQALSLKGDNPAAIVVRWLENMCLTLIIIELFTYLTSNCNQYVATVVIKRC